MSIGDFIFGLLFWTQLLGSDEVLAWVVLVIVFVLVG